MRSGKIHILFYLLFTVLIYGFVQEAISFNSLEKIVLSDNLENESSEIDANDLELELNAVDILKSDLFNTHSFFIQVISFFNNGGNSSSIKFYILYHSFKFHCS